MALFFLQGFGTGFTLYYCHILWYSFYKQMEENVNSFIGIRDLELVV